MLIQQNQMRSHRKGSRLTQSDVAFVMGIDDSTLISRWENGRRKAHADDLLTYHLLFHIPVDEQLKPRALDVAAIILERVNERIDELKPHEKNLRLHYRISYLESVASRLVLMLRA